ncbi:MAG TPA: ABC transporter ATP-binding protein [Limnochordales bacterium]
MSAVIEMKGVTKAFGGLRAVNRVNLRLDAHEILGLIGPNGAGKTTLFNLISGFILPDAGEIYYKGTSIGNKSMHERALLGISRTWQDIRLFSSLTVLDNLVLGARHYPGESIGRALLRSRVLDDVEVRLRERAMEILAMIGLADKWDTPVPELPYGQQKLVGVARALMNDGDVLLLDEPMAGVEGQAYDTMKEVIRNAARAGRAVCVVEHNVSFVKDLCTRAVFMFNGEIVAEGSVDDILANEKVTELYFGQELDTGE